MRILLSWALILVLVGGCAGTKAAVTEPVITPPNRYSSTMEEFLGEREFDEGLEAPKDIVPGSAGLLPGEERITEAPEAQAFFVDADLEDVSWRVKNAEEGLIFIDYLDEPLGRFAAYGTLQFLGEDDEAVRFVVTNPVLLSQYECEERLSRLEVAGHRAWMTLRVLAGWELGRLAPFIEDDEGIIVLVAAGP